MSRQDQPSRFGGRCGAIWAHLKLGKSPSQWSGHVCVPSGRWRLWNQGASAAISRCTLVSGGVATSSVELATVACDIRVSRYRYRHTAACGTAFPGVVVDDVVFQLYGAVVGGVARQDPGTCPGAELATFFLAGLAEVLQDVVGAVGDEDLAADREDRVEAVPAVADD